MYEHGIFNKKYVFDKTENINNKIYYYYYSENLMNSPSQEEHIKRYIIFK